MILMICFVCVCVSQDELEVADYTDVTAFTLQRTLIESIKP